MGMGNSLDAGKVTVDYPVGLGVGGWTKGAIDDFSL
jgi:hypothetical protein